MLFDALIGVELLIPVQLCQVRRICSEQKSESSIDLLLDPNDILVHITNVVRYPEAVVHLDW
jgi:hypothetical protein